MSDIFAFQRPLANTSASMRSLAQLHPLTSKKHWAARATALAMGSAHPEKGPRCNPCKYPPCKYPPLHVPACSYLHKARGLQDTRRLTAPEQQAVNPAAFPRCQPNCTRWASVNAWGGSCSGAEHFARCHATACALLHGSAVNAGPVRPEWGVRALIRDALSQRRSLQAERPSSPRTSICCSKNGESAAQVRIRVDLTHNLR